MLKYLLPLLFIPGLATAADSARLERAVQGAFGAAYSSESVREFAPGRADLAKHAVGGGAIAAVVGALTDEDFGWEAGVVVAAGKEIVNDAMLGRGHPQVDDFVVTAASAVFCSRVSADFAPLVFVDRNGAEVQFRWRF